MPLSEHVHCVAVIFKMTECIEQWIWIKFCISLNVPPWKLFTWFRRQRQWATDDWQLHHDITSCAEILVKHQITQVTQSPYSPDLAPCDFCLFPKLKSPLKGQWFQTIDKIQENMMGQLMPSPTKDFAECFEQWKRHWENCIRSQTACFEGDGGVIVLCAMFLVSSIKVSFL